MVTSKQIKPFIPLIISLLLALVLFFLVKDFVQTVILRPLLYAFWFVFLIIESIPQGVIWAGIILIMLWVAIASIRKEEPEKFPNRGLPIRNAGQVGKWARLLDYTKNDRFTKWLLAQELNRLTLKLLTLSDDTKKRHYQDRLDLPEKISAYFESQQPSTATFWERWNKQNIDEIETGLDLDPEVVIQYLEKRLKYE
jgi:hypothetical protein